MLLSINGSCLFLCSFVTRVCGLNDDIGRRVILNVSCSLLIVECTQSLPRTSIFKRRDKTVHWIQTPSIYTCELKTLHSCEYKRLKESTLSGCAIIYDVSFVYWQPHMIYLPPATKFGQGYVSTRVCDSVHGGGGLSACWDSRPPPPSSRPPKSWSPLAQCMLRDTDNKRAVRILLEGILVQR